MNCSIAGQDATINERKEAIKAYYDKIAIDYQNCRYDSDEHLSSHFMSERMRYILNFLDSRGKPGKLLDVACGPGVQASDYVQRGYEYWGVDISSGAIKEARSINKTKGIDDLAHFVEGDVEELRFITGFFDYAVAVYVFEYLEKDAKALQELHRVLKPGGILIAGLNNKYSWNRLVRMATLRPLKYVVSKLLPARHGVQAFSYRSHSPDQFKKEANSLGLSYIERHYCNFSIIPFNLRMPSYFYRFNLHLEKFFRLLAVNFAFSTCICIFQKTNFD